MKTYLQSLPLFLVMSLLLVACQQTSKTQEVSDEQVATPVAALTKRTFILGDSIDIVLNKPLQQVTVSLDGNPVASTLLTGAKLLVPTINATIGLHQLVVTGTTTDKVKTADTLNIELWSDIKPQVLSYSVLQTYPHQTSSFTQGLEFYKGDLYEGTGQNGQSRLMKVDVQTGAIRQSVPLSSQYFGEGITLVNNHIYQLTWTSGQCFRYTMNLALDKVLAYHTQGWGLTHRDSTLIVSDGSNRLRFYTLDFQKKSELVVYDDKGPVMNLNELEYVDGSILANVWQTNRIVKIDEVSGKVVGELLIDSPHLVSVDTRENVLNGIAYQPTENALYITGKNWPSLVKIRVKDLSRPNPDKTVASR